MAWYIAFASVMCFIILYADFLSRCSFLYRFRIIVFVFIACLLTCYFWGKGKNKCFDYFKYPVFKFNFFKIKRETLNTFINIECVQVIFMWAYLVKFYLCTLLLLIMYDVKSSRIMLFWKLFKRNKTFAMESQKIIKLLLVYVYLFQ